MKKTIRIATRKSPLALWQANYVKQALEKMHEGLTVELMGLLTKADKWLTTPLAKIGGKGLFVKELEQALLDGKADLAVHSIKDMPMQLPDGLQIGAVCQREDPRDVLLSGHSASLEVLPSAAVVGTSSLRRQCQLRALRSDLQVISLRGNVGTRLSRLDQGEYHAIILAAAGVKRLEQAQRIRCYLEPQQWVPAGGQGAIGIECRADDERIMKLIAVLHHDSTCVCITAERAFCARLGGSCQVPIGAYATLENEKLTLDGLVGYPDGSHILRANQAAKPENAATLGIALAEKLLHQGAGSILKQLL